MASANLFVAEGANVVITSRRQEAVDEYNLNESENTFAVLADASKPAENKEVLRQVVEKFGKIDILFLNAGIGKPAPINIMPEDLYDSQWDTNFRGPFFTTQAALFLASDDSSYVNGIELPVDGGMAQV